MTRIHQVPSNATRTRAAAGLVAWLLASLVVGAGRHGFSQEAGAGPASAARQGVAPATFTRDAGLVPTAPEPPAADPTKVPQPAAGPVKLTVPQPLAAKPSPPTQGPLPDWKLLLAVAAAFGILVAFRGLASSMTSRAAPLPPDVFDVLGSAPLGGGHSIRVVRFGPKTLLVSTSTAGCQTLAELTDPQATERIAAACTATGSGPRQLLRPRPAGVRGDSAGRASA